MGEPAAPDAPAAFLAGCGLPALWAGQAQWRVLQTRFDQGQGFLACWSTWRLDAARPRLLHFTAVVEVANVSAVDLLHFANGNPELNTLATQLAAQCRGLTPGLHRMGFDDGRVLLNLFIGDLATALRGLVGEADSIFLGGFVGSGGSDHEAASDAQAHVLAGVARLCRRGTRLASWTVSDDLRRLLRQSGFHDLQQGASAQGAHPTTTVFDPAWQPKRRGPARPAAAQPGQCAVVGAGLAGAAVAASLARRGWTVQVLDRAPAPASGASGLPAGLIAPHVSSDDSLLSRLSRCGIRMTLQQASALLSAEDWALSGVLERQFDGTPQLPAHWPGPGLEWSRPAEPSLLRQAQLPDDAPALWHSLAGWIRPARLVQAWLATPGVTWQGDSHVARMTRHGGQWQLHADGGACLATADLVVIAAGPLSQTLTRSAGAGLDLGCQVLRGQMIQGPAEQLADVAPPFPVNGHGSFVPSVPTPGGTLWLAGATYERDNWDLQATASDHRENLAKLASLLPAVAGQLNHHTHQPQPQAWSGLRYAAIDRLPLVGPLDNDQLPGLWLCTALGSRGLSFAALCGEYLAALLHDEPLPLDKRLAQAIHIDRVRRPRPVQS